MASAKPALAVLQSLLSPARRARRCGGAVSSADQTRRVCRVLQVWWSAGDASPRPSETSHTMRYLLYARVSPKGSTWDGAETTVPDQLRDGRAYVLARDPAGVCLEAWDELATADHKAMHQFRAAMESMRAGTAPWDALVCRHIDRIGRSALEVIQIGAELARHGKHLVVYAMPFPSEPPMGPLILGIFALLAEFERRMIADRTRAKMVTIARGGGIPYGTPPYGYRRAGPKNNVPEIEPREAEVVRDVYRSCANGTAYPVELGRRHGVAAQSIWNMLRRPFYHGIVEYDGQQYPGRHVPIIDRELWDRAQARLPARSTRRPQDPPCAAPAARSTARKHPYPLSGLLRCSCGRFLTPGSARGRNNIPYRYYLCTDRDGCKRRYPAAQVETTVRELLRQVPVSLPTVEEACQLLTDRMRATAAASESMAEVQSLRTALASAKAEQETLVRLFIDGVVTRDNAGLFNRRLTECQAEVARLSARIAAVVDLANPATQLADAHAWLQQFRSLVQAMDVMGDDPDGAAAVLRAVVERIEPGEKAGTWTVRLLLPGSPMVSSWQPDLDSNQD